MKRRGVMMILGAICGLGTMRLDQPSAALATAQAEPNATTLPSGTAITAELKDSLDSKKVKPGDAVKLKTTEAYKFKGQTVLPKGTELLGHVTQATVKEKGQTESTLGIALDKAILKNGEEMRLTATIQAMASGDTEGGATGRMASPSPGTPTTGAVMGSTRSGMSGSGNMSPSPTQYPGNLPNTSTNPGSGAEGPGGNGPNSAGQFTSNSHGVFGLDGLTLRPATADSSHGTIIQSTGKSVHLYGGTRILLITR